MEIQLRYVSALLAERGYHLVISPEARAYLAEIGYDADYSARSLKRAIQRELQDPLAVKILGGEFHEGEAIHVDRGKKRLEFTSMASDKSQLLKPGSIAMRLGNNRLSPMWPRYKLPS